MTRQAKGSGKKLNLSKLTDPPRAVKTQAQRPEASMNWAVLNQTRISGLWRTKVSATKAVSPPINIGQGCRSEEHTSELQSLAYLVCRLLLEKKKSISRTKKRTILQQTST